MTIAQLRELTVDNFPGCAPRETLFGHFEALVAALTAAKIRCEILCNGSFLTEANDPGDFDAVVRVDHDVAAAMDDSQALLFDGLNDDLEAQPVDTFTEVSFPLGHPDHGQEQGPTWEAHYGLEHGQKWLKGVAVVKLGETDVGLRLRR